MSQAARSHRSAAQGASRSQYRAYWQAMQRRDALRLPAQTHRGSVTRHQVVALGLGQVGLVALGEQRQQIQRHEVIVIVVDDTHTATLALATTPPAQLAHPARTLRFTRRARTVAGVHAPRHAANWRPDGGRTERSLCMDIAARPGITPCDLLRPGRRQQTTDQTLKRKLSTSPSLTRQSLPSARILPASLAPCSPWQAMKSSKAMVWARMKPRSKSPWVTPAAWGAGVGGGGVVRWRVQARTSFTPGLKKVGKPSSLKAPRISRARPGSLWPISARNSWRSASLISAISASIFAQMATTGAFWLAAYSFRRSRKGLFPKPSSPTLATNIVGLAVIRHSGLSKGCSSLARSTERAGKPWFSAVRMRVSNATSRAASLSLPDLAALVWRLSAFSTVAMSARHSSVCMTSMSEIGSTRPATWITLSSSKQRTTLTMASVSRIWARSWLPRPSPWLPPAPRPAMSTNSTMAGRMRAGATIAACCPRRGSGSSSTPTLGSTVQKGEFSVAMPGRGRAPMPHGRGRAGLPRIRETGRRFYGAVRASIGGPRSGRPCSASAVSVEAPIGRHALPDTQHLPRALAHDGVHAETDGAGQAPVLTVTAQHVAHRRADPCRGRVDIRDGATGAGFDRLQAHLAPGAAVYPQHVHPVFVVRGHARQHEVRPETLDAHGGVAGGQQPAIEFLHRCLAEQQQRETIAELVRSLPAVRQLHARQTPVLGVEPDQPTRLAQKIAEPLRRHSPHIPCRHPVLPQGHGRGGLDGVERHMQGQHAGSAQHHVVAPELRPNQRHAGQVALGHEHAVGVDHHPGAVQIQPGFRQQGLLHSDAGAGFDGIHEQARNVAGQMAIGVETHAVDS